MASNCYDVLGVSRDASVEEIKKAYKKAALTHHPDKGGDSEKFKECSAAVETLTDERKRSAYDHALIRANSRDGLAGRYGDRDCSADRARGSSVAPRPSQERAPSKGGGGPSGRPPRPPGAAVEIPADPSSLSIRELKELLTDLGIDHEGCLEKADLLALLQRRKERRPNPFDSGRGDTTPRGAASRAKDNPSTPRQRAAAEERNAAAAAAAAAAATAGSAAAPAAPSQAKGPRALRVKVMSLGSGAVGKSTLIKRYCEGRFVQKYISTIGIDYGVKPVKVLGHDLKVNFFDTSGGGEFRDIRTEFYGMGDTSGVLLVFDVTSRRSFSDLNEWLNEAGCFKCRLSNPQRDGELPIVVLCANKTDLPKRAVSKDEGAQFAAKHGMHYFETSAATGEAVVESMTFLFEQVVGNHLEARKRFGAG